MVKECLAIKSVVITKFYYLVRKPLLFVQNTSAHFQWLHWNYRLEAQMAVANLLTCQRRQWGLKERSEADRGVCGGRDVIKRK